MTGRVEQIRSKLETALAPIHLEVVDDSAAHAGHAGAVQSGGGHFSALIVSQAFEGKSPVKRHQLVYQALGDMLQSDIHAIAIKALSPSEYP